MNGNNLGDINGIIALARILFAFSTAIPSFQQAAITILYPCSLSCWSIVAVTTFTFGNVL